MILPQVDAVIVGSGAGGGVAAHVLSFAGRHVVLLERGRNQQFSETRHDELHSQRTTVLGNAFGPDDTNVRLVKLGDAAQFREVRASDGSFGNVAMCLGGGTKSYGAMAWRFLPKDFRMRSTYGAPEGSSLENWPISYEELEPYYERAEYAIGVSGQRGANSFEGARKRDYPMPPMPYNKEARKLQAAAKGLGWHPFPIPMAINSVAYDGRPACIQCPFCVGFACEVKAKGSTADTVIPKAIATGHCELRTECVATEILTDAKGRATGVVYIRNGARYEQPAKAVVVSCSAIESARLLLASKSKLFPGGLGNLNGLVGRNLQSHAYAGAYGYFEDEVWDGLGPAACIALCDFNHGNDGYRGGAMLAHEFIRKPYMFARGAHPPNASTWGLDHKARQKKFYKRSIAVQGPVQEMPVFTNGIELDPSRKDAFGMPLVRMTGKRHDEDLRTARFIAGKADALLKAAGAIETFLKLPGSATSFGQHQAGTCRMGNDPKTSVTNSYGQMHSVDNVFVVDGSLHVTNGGFNPSLTIQAVAFRASEYIARSF